MSEQIVRRVSPAIDIRATLPWFVAAGVYALLLVLAPRLLADPDSYSHIALGRWILEHRAVPTVDPFSLTLRGEHWVAFEWLSQAVYANAMDLGGWTAVVALAAAAAAATFGLLTRFLLRDWQPRPVLIAVLAAFVLTAPHILARPHMLATPLIFVWVATLIRAVDDGRAPPWWLLPLMTLWANLHGSFTFGLAMTGAIAFEALWRATPHARVRVLRQWALFGVLAIVAACINPYGPAMILVTIKTIALGASLSVITEWRPQDFTHLGAFEMIMLAGIGFALYRGVTLPWTRIVMLLGILHLSLSQSRHADLLALLAPVFLAHPLAAQFPAIAAERMRASLTSAWPIAIGIGGLMIAVTALAGAWATIVPAARITPTHAVKAIEAAGATRVLNDYNFGGYLDFVGIPVFIDGRGELYGTAFTLRYDRALNLQDLPDFLRLLDEHRFGATLLAPSTPAVGLMDRLPDWQRVYADDIAVVHIRRAK